MSQHENEKQLTRRAFDALVSRLADEEPRTGYQAPEQIPALTDAELAIVLRREPSVLADACGEEVVANVMAAFLADAERDRVDHYLSVGCLVMQVLQAGAANLVGVEDPIHPGAERYGVEVVQRSRHEADRRAGELHVRQHRHPGTGLP